MITIDHDPASKIPVFTERTFNNSIIIAVWKTNYSVFVSYVIKTGNVFKFRGSHKANHYMHSDQNYSRPVTWSDSINSGQTLLHLLERDWEGRVYPQSDRDPWNVKYYIVENLSDLTKVLDEYIVDGQLRIELLNRFNEVSR